MTPIKSFVLANPAVNHSGGGFVEPEKRDGKTIIRGFHGNMDRLRFDCNECSKETGWRQYDTDQDAWYFGIWVHMETRTVFTYCEGDLTLVECETTESFKRELDDLAEFHGPPPPAFKVFDLDAGTQTNIYDNRPTSDEL